MTDYEDASKRHQNKTLNLEDIEKAIVNGKQQRIKALISNQLFDELQKGYLIRLAKKHKQTEIEMLLRGTPATP